MSTITSSEVLSLMQISADTADATSAIDTSEVIVSEDLSNLGHSTARLLQIQLYLAAHFFEIAWNQGGLVSKQVGDSKEEYNRQSAFKRGFDSTRYGEQALALETTGILASIGSSAQRAEFRVV